MAETSLVYRTIIPVPASELFAWHARDGAFERLTPPWMDVQVSSATGTVNPGDAKTLKLGVGPLSMSWSLVHKSGSSQYSFTDEQVSGPFKSWSHEHRFLPNGPEHSILEDRIHFELPFDTLVSRVAGGQVRAQLDQLFRFRHRRTLNDLARHADTGASSPMRVAVTGASGMIGSQLVAFLRTGGHSVARLVRHDARGDDEIFWNPKRGEIDADALEGFDAVIHLAGASIAGGRWTRKRKESILNSRLEGTRLLSETLAKLRNPPGVLVSASGIGYYGDTGSSILTEDAPKGRGFLAEVCEIWEQSTSPAAAAGIRVVNARFGVVLSETGGLLQQLGRLFRLGGGGQLGRGDQFMSWIALDDLLGVLLESISNPALEGPVNAVAPNPITNTEFTRSMANVLGRPAIFRVPARVLRIAAGELADELLLASQRAEPARLQSAGFRFDYPTLEQALRQELGRSGAPEAVHAVETDPRPRLQTSQGE